MTPFERVSAILRTTLLVAFAVFMFLLWGVADGMDWAAGL